jgi:hypothetical protein
LIYLPLPIYGTNLGLKRRVVGIIIITAVLGLSAAALFILRAPVLMVLDDEFTGLYGARRTLIKQAETSLLLFRRVKVVRIADGASPDVIAFAVVAAAAKPYAALFSVNSLQGARRYAEQAPGIPIGVFGGGVQAGAAVESGLVFIETDRLTDFYRAGRCAAVFALSGGGGIIFFTGDLGKGLEQEAFLRGLRDQGFEGNPTFVGRGGKYTLPEGLSCVVMASPTENYLDNNPTVPSILFSWIDPGISPREIKLIFDDSPWALAPAAVKMLYRQDRQEGAAGEPAPSEILVPRGRIGDVQARRDIKKAIRSKYID